MDTVLIGIFGALGAITRYWLGKLIAQKSSSPIPIGTLVINISGAVLLGAVNGMQLGAHLTLLLADGFLGAYTTFSTFMVEGFQLFQGNKKLNAVVYITGSVVIGVAGYFAGYGLAGAFSARP